MDSNSSRDFPLVSGKIFNNIKKPKTAIMPNIKKVNALPRLESSQGKIS